MKQKAFEVVLSGKLDKRTGTKCLRFSRDASSSILEPGTYAVFLVGGLGVLTLAVRARRRVAGPTAA